jgi:hypothetical protein
VLSLRPSSDAHRRRRRGAKRFVLTPIADTNDRFSDFAPYVASINDAGTVAFQAALRSGGTGVFTASGGHVAAAAESATTEVSQFYSHPDIGRDGALCVYGALASGGEGIILVKGGDAIPIADTSGSLACIGPLGPTMNDRNTLAFRADTKAGRRGVFAQRRGRIVTVADTSCFAGFQGLPVINGKGTVVFRADLDAGGHGIYLSDGEAFEAVAVTGDCFHELGFFPCVNGADMVVFSATLSGGGAGIFTVADGKLTTIVDTNSGFESFRGALINERGTVFFYGIPRGGRLGIYAGAGPMSDAIVSIGDPLFDSSVDEFALNPVSINNCDQLAIRIRLANDRHLIVRADPVG